MTSAAQLALDGAISPAAAAAIDTRRGAGRRLYAPYWDEIKRVVLRRDGYACRICGAPGTRWSLQVHHLTPVRFGGSSEPANLVTLCPECHARLHREGRVFRGARTFEGVEEEWT